MTPLRRFRFLSCVLTVCALIAAAAPVAAQPEAFPQRPIKLVIPFAAGGATDVLGRVLAVAMGQKLGQPVVVENKPGASTMLAAGLVAKAPPDGYTLLLGSSTTLTLNPAIRTQLSYDALKSFTPLGMVADMPLVLVAAPTGPGSLKELIAQAKADPSRFSYGSYGAGSSVHFGAEMLKAAAGIQMVHIPFNGSAPSLTALMGGQMELAVDTVVASTPLIKSGRIKPLAVLSAQRLPLLPQVPTVVESGYPGFEMGSWFALLAPAGLPPQTRMALQKALADVSVQPDFQQKMLDLGLVSAYGDGAALTARIEKELPQMRAVAARAGIKPD
ncbi:Bug family tripartite tricarboxylate transporter substrate binding protein [Variovorax ginsengisoli]|uniref:Tripartite-type tricarboxylate transporter receptor subunit TctC n=1 Tax=Variovorax ginsengisoli TaxID=363844 RepID=A0ABT9SB06_9BURK|nr:tripartite tricarboxylate transporter substrate binding protein [Variovorax ginsengisoli]MDP9901099.1 tripartite-type tricarboxylate transporter receptor subunit TctC [Variovorax ginsengisoli]